MIWILNALFDAQAQAIDRHGGEILKFIGDGLLAIFPIDDGATADRAATSALVSRLQRKPSTHLSC
jgi:adenylate cyclase